MRWAGVSCGGGWLAAAEAAVQIQAALEPGMDRIVPLDQGEDAGAARPLQGPEQPVIGIGRLATADEGLVLDDGPVRSARPAAVVDTVRADGPPRIARPHEAHVPRVDEVVAVAGADREGVWGGTRGV